MASDDEAFERARAVKAKAKRVFSQLATVSSVGLTYHEGQPAVKIGLEEDLPADREAPEEIDGVRIVCRVDGHVHKQSGR